jgi:hypothetical protein
VYWFSYDGNGKQAWFYGLGEQDGSSISISDMYITSGGHFGPDFDPDKVTRKVVGSASFIWSSCDSGAMEWLIDKDGNGRRHGRLSLLRITRVMGLDCGRPMGPSEIEEGQLSGSWYDPTHSGEGYVLEVLVDQRAVVYWFSYDPEGNRRWFFGTGEILEDKIVFSEMFTTSGGIFGDDFDPESVEVEPWGSLELELQCNFGIARFTPIEAGFPAGTLNLERLTFLEGLSCEP